MPKVKPKKIKDSGLSKQIRRLGVLAEDTNRNVMLVAEQYLDVSKDVKSIRKTLDGHSAKLDSHSSKLDSNTEMIGDLTVNMSIVKEDLGFIKSSLKRKVDVEEFSALERRVAHLKKKAIKTASK
jgi:archaellum component FlaC